MMENMTERKIRVLNKDISEKIAAGEVIERPVSIVKELVENSIDAGASTITVDIKKGGKTYIRVTDDGWGIPEEDVETAFMRHGTSKIRKDEDLDAIGTLGFRGEALTSIAAVSKTELVTKTAKETKGTRLIIEGGEIISKKSTGAPEGTTVLVRDVFYNTPARLKFLKSDNAESTAVIEFVSQMALAYPDIKFKMKSNDRFLFSTKGNGERGNTIVTLSSQGHANTLIHFTDEDENQGLSIDGYISGPRDTTRGRKRQIFFVNGRVVDSKLIRNAIDDGFREKMFEGYHPIAYIFLYGDPATIDVNIHPNKREVRFNDEKAVHDFIRDAVRKATDTKDAIPDVFEKIAPRPSAHPPFKDRPDLTKISPGSRGLMEDDKKDRGRSVSKNPGGTEQMDIKTVLSEFRKGTAAVSEEIGSYKAHITEKRSDETVDFGQLEIIDTVFATYILAKDEDFIYIIDQHAAHERVLYESILESYKKGGAPGQQVMMPITLESFREEGGWMEELDRYGFKIEAFGPGIYKTSQIPMAFTIDEARLFLEEYMDNIDTVADFKDISATETCAMRACKAAVKANDSLKDIEIKELMKDLSRCENPYTCPHGRPTFIKMGEKDLEKRFKRI